MRLLIASLVIVALSATPVQAQTVWAAGWQSDLTFLVSELNRLHPNPYFFTPRSELDDAVARLNAAIPALGESEIIAGFHEILALPSRAGRDGHSGMRVIDSRFERFFPLETYMFTNGLFILQARAPHQDLDGSRILTIDSMPVEDVFLALDPLISRDNDWNVLSKLPAYLLNPQLLHAVGAVRDVGEVELVVERNDGAVFPVIVPSVDLAMMAAWLDEKPDLPPVPVPLYLSNLEEAFWFTLLEESGTLYVRYLAVRRETPSGETMTEFAQRLGNAIAESSPERFVIDVRLNGGGNNTTYEPLLQVISGSESINQHGRLFTITDRDTFSAASNFVSDMQRRTQTLLVGEPTGGAPNAYGDAVEVTLPNSGYVALISTRYHERSLPTDERLTHFPDLPARLHSHDFYSGRDPSMEAILKFRP